ncbi:MAG: hypothetical protein RBR53_05950 [Desulforegulaceae bacterium]|nr:hypothetical protein [Desulforegulaceae bacterium]
MGEATDNFMKDVYEELNLLKECCNHTEFNCLDSGDPITEGLIWEIHRKLVKGVRGVKTDHSKL